MKKENCIFCNFSDNKVVLYDDDLCYAAISKDPINNHHILVIPKEHYENFVDLPDNLASHIFLIAKKVSSALRKAVKPEAIHHIFDDDISQKGYNLVSHYKFHLIPRFKDDGIKMEWNRKMGVNLEKRSQFASEIKKFLD